MLMTNLPVSVVTGWQNPLQRRAMRRAGCLCAKFRPNKKAPDGAFLLLVKLR
jgi:hypothetical protein